MTDRTISDVFIIESLMMEEEDFSNRYEGRRLAELLRLSGKNPKYFYFTSKNEIPHLMELFRLSKYRYLHISCHASENAINTTEDELTFPEFSSLCKNYLKLRRVFFSACSLGSPYFTDILAGNNKGMQSLTAPAQPIDFDYAAAIWSALYVSLFNRNTRSMTSDEISKALTHICKLFPVDFYFGKYRSEIDNWQHLKIENRTGKLIILN